MGAITDAVKKDVADAEGKVVSKVKAFVKAALSRVAYVGVGAVVALVVEHVLF
jgi:hypothetical protein